MHCINHELSSTCRLPHQSPTAQCLGHLRRTQEPQRQLGFLFQVHLALSAKNVAAIRHMTSSLPWLSLAGIRQRQSVATATKTKVRDAAALSRRYAAVAGCAAPASSDGSPAPPTMAAPDHTRPRRRRAAAAPPLRNAAVSGRRRATPVIRL